jgi:hypothetical protein
VQVDNRPPETRVKTYSSDKQIRKGRAPHGPPGLVPQGQVGSSGRASLTGTAVETGMTGGLGFITGFSRKGEKITVTWVRQ